MKQLVIIGAGDSLKIPVANGLWNKLKGRYTIGLNYNYQHFNNTCLMGVDDEFYNAKVKTLEPLPLIVFGFDKEIKKYHPNTIVLRTRHNYLGRDLSKGIYCSRLTGMFALTLGINLLDVGEIFLLGYDFGWNPNKIINKQYATHYYQGDVEPDSTKVYDHRGIGHCSYYDTTCRIKTDFEPYLIENKVKIYNVIGEPESKTPTFEKISYDTFYNKLNKGDLDQEWLRKSIRQKLEEYSV